MRIEKALGNSPSGNAFNLPVCFDSGDKDVRGWEKTSDHAPAWIELKDGRKRK